MTQLTQSLTTNEQNIRSFQEEYFYECQFVQKIQCISAPVFSLTLQICLSGANFENQV